MKHFQSRAERILIGIILIFLAIPLPLTILSHIPLLSKTMRLGHLAGMQMEETYTPFSWPALTNAKYQASVGRFFDDEFFGRAPLIKLTNELFFRFFKASPMKSALLIVGKKDELYGAQYLEEYYLHRRRRDEIEPLVSNLKKLQDACERMGIGYLVLVTPSKASIEPELNPNRWKLYNNARARVYDLFVPMLKQYGIHYVDSHAIMEQAKSHAPAPLFPQGGIHWGKYGAFLASNAIISEFQSQGKPLQQLEYENFKISDQPFGDDVDILDLMNLMFRWHYPVTEFDIKPVQAKGRKPNLVFVSGSFMWRLADILSSSRQFSEVDCFYYYKRTKKCYVDGKMYVIGSDLPSVDFAHEIFAADNLILELNEEMMPDIPNHLTAFTEDALKNLPDFSKPKPEFHSAMTGVKPQVNGDR